MSRPRLSREQSRHTLPGPGSAGARPVAGRGCGMRAGREALPERRHGPPASRAASDCSGQPSHAVPPRRDAGCSAPLICSFRGECFEFPGRSAAAVERPSPGCPGCPRSHVPESRALAVPPGGQAGGGPAHRPLARSPRPRSPALGAPGRAARGPAAAPRAPRHRLPAGARAAPLVSMSERRACGLRAAASALLTCTGPAAPPGPRRAPRAAPRWLHRPRQRHPAERLLHRAAGVGSKGKTHLSAPDGQDKPRARMVILPAPPGCGSHQKCMFLGRTRGEVRSGVIAPSPGCEEQVGSSHTGVKYPRQSGQDSQELHIELQQPESL